MCRPNLVRDRKPANRGEHGEKPDGELDAQKPVAADDRVALVCDRDEKAARDHDCQAADHHAGRQVATKGIDLEPRDEQTIEQTEDRGHQEHEHAGRGIGLVGHLGSEDTGEGEDCAGREVEPAGDDDECRGAGDDADRRRLGRGC